MDFTLFAGRFHPLIVHLPIGILILAFLFEWIRFLKPKSISISANVLRIMYVIGAFAALMAIASGWLLSSSEDYGIKALNAHKNLGFATLAALIILLVIHWKGTEKQQVVKVALSGAVVLLTFLTGHFGGNLTHGPSYLLEYGPSFLRPAEQNTTYGKVDSFVVYTQIIQPVIEEKCLPCHQTGSAKGGLVLDEYEDLFKEADNGIPIVAGNLLKSEFYTRVTLPRDDEKAMPPRDPGLNYTEIKLLEYWIHHNADRNVILDSEEMSPELIALVLRDYDLDFGPKPYYETVTVDSLEASLLKRLNAAGFAAQYLSESNFLLDVQFNGDLLGEEAIAALNAVAGNITYLKISNAGLTDEGLENLAAIPHLMRMDLSNNAISAAIPGFLTNSPHLEAVNLNGTSVDKSTVEILLRNGHIKRVYVWNTEVSEEEISGLQQAFEGVEVISTFRFQEVTAPVSVFEKRLTSE